MLICVGSLVIFLSVIKIQSDFRSIVGEPSTELNLRERTYYSIILLKNIEKLNQPANIRTEPVAFIIDSGESTDNVINDLKIKGLISSDNVFRVYLQYSGLDKSLQAGKYTIEPSLSPIEIASLFQDASPENIEFNILAGWRISEIAEMLPTSGLKFTPAEFLSASLLLPEPYKTSLSVPDHTQDLLTQIMHYLALT